MPPPDPPQPPPVLVPASAPVPVSVVVLTYNEEANITDCLASCGWCDDVHVLDSGSTDRTVELARAAGATVHMNPFRSFGQQRNWAIDHVGHRHEWVFHLDADERFAPELVAEMAAVVAADPPVAGYYVPHKLIFMGRWLRRAEGGYPVYQMRLFHRGRMRFRDWGHGQREDTAGRIGTLRRPYLHFNFSKGLEDWIEKHNRYSTLEARELVASPPYRPAAMTPAASTPAGGRGAGAAARFWGTRVERRRYFKSRVWPWLPGTWFLRFCWMYVANRGFLDGLPGFHYCVLISAYELWTKLKAEEIQLDLRERVPVPADAVAAGAAADRPMLASTSG